MPVADFAQGVNTPTFAMVRHSGDSWHASKANAQTASAASAAKTASTGDGKSFWDDVLDVVNPLQHLPIVGTIYRNITGDKMGDLEKVAGDTLYGGPLGLVSSLADVAFEKITGKDFEDTVLGLFRGGDSTTAVAAKSMKPLPSRSTLAAATQPAVNKPAALVPASIVPAALAAPAKTSSDAKQAAATTQADPNTQALLASMTQSGVDSDLGMRALFAYQKSIGLSPTAPDGLSAAP
jgi:hypothetical protein